MSKLDDFNKNSYTDKDLYEENIIDEPKFLDQQKQSFNIKDIGKGFNILKNNGKTGKYFLIAVIAIFALIILNAFHIIPMWLYSIFLVGFAIVVVYVFFKLHENDEETLD